MDELHADLAGAGVALAPNEPITVDHVRVALQHSRVQARQAELKSEAVRRIIAKIDAESAPPEGRGA